MVRSNNNYSSTDRGSIPLVRVKPARISSDSDRTAVMCVCGRVREWECRMV